MSTSVELCLAAAFSRLQHHKSGGSRLRILNPFGYQRHARASAESGTGTTIVRLSERPNTSRNLFNAPRLKSNSPTSFVRLLDTVSPLQSRLTGISPIPWSGFL